MFIFRLTTIRIICIWLMLPLACFAENITTQAIPQQTKQTAERKYSYEIELIINELKINDWELDVSKLDLVKSDNEIRENKEDEFEHYTLQNFFANDVFIYTVIYNKKTREFWIKKEGGLAGVRIFYGPGYLDKTGKIIKQKEKINEISYIDLKVKDKFAKQSKKVKIENKNEIEIIVYSISHYKEKRLLDLICMYQLEIYGTGSQIIRTYEVGEFRDNKNILLIRDKERNEDYIIDGEGAAKIYEYLGRLK